MILSRLPSRCWVNFIPFESEKGFCKVHSAMVNSITKTPLPLLGIESDNSPDFFSTLLLEKSCGVLCLQFWVETAV